MNARRFLRWAALRGVADAERFMATEGDTMRRRWQRGVTAAIAAMSLIFASEASAGVIHQSHDVSIAERYGAAGPFRSVGQFVVRSASNQAWSGSGVYLGDGWVLTAAHVAEDAASMTFSVDGQQRVAESTYLHPNWSSSALLAGNDLALVKLNAELPTITAATRMTTGREIGGKGASIGYGRTGDADTGYSTSTTLSKRGGRNTVDAIYNNRLLLMDFDSGAADDNATGRARPVRFEYLIAPGDSGGGLFIYQRNLRQWQLAGIHSFGWGLLDGDANASYGDVSGHTRVRFHNRWIDRVLAGYDNVSLTSGESVSTRLFTATALNESLVPEPAAAVILSVLGLPLLLRRR
ncbi:MAG: trypsin-like serine protease [Planctomycetota bacterium]